MLSPLLLGWLGEPPATDGSRPAVNAKPSRPEIRASLDESSRSPIPYEIALEVARLESVHRLIVCRPVESWNLEPVRLGYEAVLKKGTDARSQQILSARLERVAGQPEMARSARKVQALLDQGRKRNDEVALVMRTLDALEGPSRRPFLAEGQIQASSRQVEGRRVFALIGKEGNAIAYLDVPPGLDLKGLSAKRVGVRGLARYNEDLGNRLIAVRDLEALN
jgi:hypothetical protein